MVVDREHSYKILADTSEVADNHLCSLEGRRGRISPIKQLVSVSLDAVCFGKYSG
jgi:hypothetical protein